MVDMFTLLRCILCSVIDNPETADLSRVRRSMKILFFYCVTGHCRFYAWPVFFFHTWGILAWLLSPRQVLESSS